MILPATLKSRFYVVYGDDVYLRREVRAAIPRSVLGEEADEMAVSRFEGKAARLADVLDELANAALLLQAADCRRR